LNTNNYSIRTATSDTDCARLKKLFDLVFKPEPVGLLAETIFTHYPTSKADYWFLAECNDTGELAAAFTLIPWQWHWYDQTLKIAEQGIVATHPDHQGKGLQKLLNNTFDQVVGDEQFDLAVIQGIPGFYHKFGYHYALPIDNHVNVEWRQIPEQKKSDINFRIATEADIPFLIEQEKRNLNHYQSSTKRSEQKWSYLLSHSIKTEYGSDIWIAEKQTQPQFYCRRPYTGFGDGLILSELSEGLSYSEHIALLNHLKVEGSKHNKPYLRLNLHNEASLSALAQSLGSKEGQPYGWQIKIPDLAQWINLNKSLLEQRLSGSSLSKYSGCFRIDRFKNNIDLIWSQGKLISVKNSEGDSDTGACIPPDLVEPLLLGRHTIPELRMTRPDIFAHNNMSALLFEILFPKVRSWHHIPY